MTERRTRLSTKLLMYTFVAILAAAGVFFALRGLCGLVIDRRVYTRETVVEREQEIFGEFVAFLNREGVRSFTEREKIQPFFEEQRDLIIAVYNGGRPFSGEDDGIILYSTLPDAPAAYEMLEEEYASYWFNCPVMVQGDLMRSKLLKIMYFPMYTARKDALYVSAGLSFAAFALTLILLVRRKTGYMSVLARELQGMEGGELNVPVTVKGNDELTTLAENMESMRLSFIERLNREEELTRKSSRLLTDMSHDLRTPLTALIGYLDIIQSGKCAPEDKERYTASALKRAYQIKDMTDELFEYFLVYSASDTPAPTEPADAVTIMGQMWDESAFSLESEGFSTELEIGAETRTLNVNVKNLRRVFDNIVSNVRKYGDRSVPVRASLDCEGDMFVVTVRNGISAQRVSGESSGIGLASCAQIAAMHGGRFESGEEDGQYVCRLLLPAVKDEG